MRVAHLTFAGITYYAPGDERAIDEWLRRIDGVGVIERDAFVVETPVSDDSLRELLAVFRRFNVDMRQLVQLETPLNVAWFRRPEACWHDAVFE